MQVRRTQTRAAQTKADALVVGLLEDQPPIGPAAEVDAATGGLLTRLIEGDEISGKANATAVLLAPPGVEAGQVLIVGLGPHDELSRGAVFRAAGTAAKTLAAKTRSRVAFFLGSSLSGELIESAVAGALVGSQGQDLYRAEKKLHPPDELLFGDADEASLAAGEILGSSVNLTRRLVNAPPDEIYPASFADQAAALGKQHGLQVEIWDKARLEEEKCGALLAVARGSAREPRLVIASYQGAAPSAPRLALVGKGVTFDSGGLSIKPSESMLAMKCDMAGAATVLGALAAIARLKLPVNVVGLMGLVENMTGPAAYKLGDVLRARSGTTIEVHNTDAEGRLVLADVLDVARTHGAAAIIDLATLTGACMVALGLDVAGLMTNNQPWCDTVAQAARSCGELVWQLPMFPEYNELIHSDVADIKNVGQGRWGGAITAAKLLERFVGEVPWTHIDIAGPAFRDKPKPWCDAGASGQPLRTLVEVARGWK